MLKDPAELQGFFVRIILFSEQNFYLYTSN